MAPAGYANAAVACTRLADVKVYRPTWRGCVQDCPDDYKKFSCTCSLPFSTYLKDSYTRPGSNSVFWKKSVVRAPYPSTIVLPR